MSAVETWLRYIASELHARKLLASAGGPILLVQLENEYSMVSEAYGDDGTRYLQWCADLQKQLSFGVPAFMCYGAAEGVLETINSFYAHDAVESHRKRHPDQPPVWTECWTGWYDVWGAPHHRRPTCDLAYAVARFFASGGAAVNYYMWMGGSNVGRTPMYLQATSYDYDAPVDEYYRETTKFRHLRALHAVIQTAFATYFLRVRDIDPVMKDGVVIWGDVAFLCNDSPVANAGMQLSGGGYSAVIKERSVHIVDVPSGKLLFDTAHIAEENIVKSKLVQVRVKATPWESVVEPIPCYATAGEMAAVDGRDMHTGDMPCELIKLTRDESDYAFYSSRFRRIGIDSEVVFQFEANDMAHVFMQGRIVGGTKPPLWEDRWSNKWNEYADGGCGNKHEIVVKSCQDEEIDVTILTSSLGLIKGDWQLGNGRNMLEEQKGLLSDVHIVNSNTGAPAYQRVAQWISLSGLRGEARRYADGGVSGNGGHVPGWFSCKLTLDRACASWTVDLAALGKGVMWVNGELLGRFWNVSGTREKNGFLKDSPIVQDETDGPTQRFYHIPGWLAQPVEGELRLHMVLFVECGPAPVADLTLFEPL